MPEWLLWVYAGVVGGCIGSFLNVCIYRLPAGESVVSPPSHCPHCDIAIGWRDNIPVVSYLLLRGRCRGCGARISPQYPLVELVCAAIWVGAVLRYGAEWQALVVALFFTLLLGIALTDARTYIIPDEFSIGGTILGVLLSFLPGGITFTASVVGAVLGFGFLYLTGLLGTFWLKKPAMGGGDIKMMAMIGAFLGPLGAVLTVFLGALVGTLVFLPFTLRTRRLVPFGIFLAVGAAVTTVWGEAILTWYRVKYLGG